jgi:hypothetical protein
MRQLLTGLWYDEAGSVVAVQWVIVVSVLLLGAVTGLAVLRDTATPEAHAITAPLADR